MSTPIEYGKKISLDVANRIIEEHERLKKNVKKKAAPDLSKPDKELTEEFMKRDNNAFIFSMKLIKEFQEATPEAEYLVVVLGAHPKNLASKHFKGGSFTLVTAGCIKTEVDGKVKFLTLNIENPAIEYPGKKVMAKLVKKEGFISGDQIEFTVL